MGPDRRIADYISANRGKFTREAITQQLLEAGYEQGAIDATWAVLDTPDPDDVVGEGFWGRFWIYLIGLNVVGVPAGRCPDPDDPERGRPGGRPRGSPSAIGALIALGIVAVTGPTRLGRGTAIAIGGIVPLIFTFLIAGVVLRAHVVDRHAGAAAVERDAHAADRPADGARGIGSGELPAAAEGETLLQRLHRRADQLERGPGQRLRQCLSRDAGGELVPSVSASPSATLRRSGAFVDYQSGSGPSAGHRAGARLDRNERLADLRGLPAGRSVRRSRDNRSTASTPTRSPAR